jgi:CubicO group peptidase (beta-lactamase class C family)
MPTLASKIVEIQTALDSLARQHKVPGASLGVASGDERIELVCGVANLNTRVPVRTSTLFQIGSNTKVYTATLVMQLVDEGLVDLDAPVRKYIPELQLADAKVLPKITVRMLLTHTSGIEGDYFEDFGRGDDGVERYVDSFSSLGQIYQPGEMWSYCNSGWVLLGRLVEKLRGEPYHKVLRDRVLTPIGASTTTLLMEEMLARSCAVGHMLMPGATEPIVPPTVMLSPSASPAGSMTASTPAEVLRFVAMHLDSGRAKDGTQVLSAKSAKAMQQPQDKLPQSSLGAEMGLGWMLSEWDGERVIGHGGGTIGQLSFLQILPDRRFAVVLLTNSTTGGALWRDLGRYLFDEFTGVHMTEIPKAPDAAPKIDLQPYTGSYRRLGVEMELKVEDGKLVIETKGTGPLASLAPPQTGTCRPIDKETFLTTIGGQDVMMQFIDFDHNGRPKYVHAGGRVAKRLDAATAKPRSKAKAKARAKPKAKAKKAPAKRSRKR